MNSSEDHKDFDVYISRNQLTEFDVGQNASFICKISQIIGPMTAEWRREKDKRIVRRKHFPLSEVDTGSSSHKMFDLDIETVTIRDSGWYTCQANSSIGSDRDSILLSVISKWCGPSILNIS